MYFTQKAISCTKGGFYTPTSVYMCNRDIRGRTSPLPKHVCGESITFAISALGTVSGSRLSCQGFLFVSFGLLCNQRFTLCDR